MISKVHEYYKTTETNLPQTFHIVKRMISINQL